MCQLETMCRRRISLIQEMDKVEAQVETFRSALLAAIAPLSKQCLKDEPKLRTLIKASLPNEPILVDGYYVSLDGHVAYEKVKYKDLFVKVEKVAAKLFPQMYRMIKRLRRNPAYMTVVPEIWEISVERISK